MHNSYDLDDASYMSFIKSIQHSVERLSAKPLRRKDPVGNKMLQSLCSLHKDTNTILILRNW